MSFRARIQESEDRSQEDFREQKDGLKLGLFFIFSWLVSWSVIRGIGFVLHFSYIVFRMSLVEIGFVLHFFVVRILV